MQTEWQTVQVHCTVCHCLHRLNDADGMANSAGALHCLPLSASFRLIRKFMVVQAYLSENLGSLRYSLQPGKNTNQT